LIGSLVEGEHEDFTLTGTGDLTLDKVESLLGIQGSGKSGLSTNSVGLIIKGTANSNSKKVVVSSSSIKKKNEEKQGDSSIPPASSSSLVTRSGGPGGKGKVPKVTLKFGMPSALPSSIAVSNANLSSVSSDALQLTGTAVTATLGSLLSATGVTTITNSALHHSNTKASQIAMKSRASSAAVAATATPTSEQDANTQVTISVSNVPVSYLIVLFVNFV
jgi:hypothetical protein